MSFSIWFHPDAETETNEAATYLDNKSPGLGGIFLYDLEKALNVITQHPESSPVVRGRVRRKILKKFPYSLIYTLTGDVIRILAVSHQRRRPFYWLYRR
jgi:toxin ParE1/3/4